MSEENLWTWLGGVLPLGHYSRIESDTSPGFPDVYAKPDWGSQCTIELKHSRGTAKIPFKNEDDGLHKSQRIWIRDELRAGGKVWIFAQVGTSVLLIPGAKYSKFNGSTQQELWELAEKIIERRNKRKAAAILSDLLLEKTK